MNEFPDNVVELVNARLGGFNKMLGLSFVEVRPDELVAELEISEAHHQPYGLVHGGVYSSMIETVCSTAAALAVFGSGQSAVGLDNSTSFLRAVRSGTLRCVATPLVKGRKSHVWDGRVYDDKKRLVASGRVRLLVLEADAKAGGEKVVLEGEQES